MNEPSLNVSDRWMVVSIGHPSQPAYILGTSRIGRLITRDRTTTTGHRAVSHNHVDFPMPLVPLNGDPHEKVDASCIEPMLPILAAITLPYSPSEHKSKGNDHHNDIT